MAPFLMIDHWEDAIDQLEGAYAPSTLRAYRNDFSVFADWCDRQGIAPLPASSTMVSEFLTEYTEISSPATLKRRLAGIRKLHRLHRLPDPTGTEEIAIVLRRAFRSRPSRPAQALGLTRTRRDALLAVCSDDLFGLRNRALVRIGYDTLCRRSELVALRAEDLEVRENGSQTILVRRAKNDPFGLGRTAWISKDGVQILKGWLDAAGICRGALFRPVYKGTVVDRFLHPYTVTRVLKELSMRAGFAPLDASQISGHSMRVGAAQDLMSDGRDILTIMRAGGWKSMNVVSRYVENADLKIWD